MLRSIPARVRRLVLEAGGLATQRAQHRAP
jgi:hypothetical protein